MVKGDKAPVYEETLEDLGRFNDQPAIPFNAYGTLAAARSEFEANSASSQVFWLLKESELTPSGANLLDGRYAVLGYVVDGADLLADVQVGDRIDYIKVVSGGELLVKGGGGSSASAAAAAAAAPTAAAAAEVAAAQ
jgi:cyclophilin family peptidyl-prolyl cis-trans isomerase